MGYIPQVSTSFAIGLWQPTCDLRYYRGLQESAEELQLGWTGKSGTMRSAGIKPWHECDRMEKSCAEVLREE